MDFRLMSYDFTDTQVLVAAFTLVVLMIVAVAAFLDRRGARATARHNRFSPEYARVFDERSRGERHSGHGAEGKPAEREPGESFEYPLPPHQRRSGFPLEQ